MNLNRLTPTQRRMYALLADGRPHPRDELVQCLPNGRVERRASHIHPHLNEIRLRIRPYGYDIICRLLGRRIQYQYVQLVGTAGP